MFIVVVMTLTYIPCDTENHAFIIGAIASITLALLDMYSPSVIVIEKNEHK